MDIGHMGRHREFDIEEALDASVSVFWSKGYEGASYADLTKATGVERPSLYAAFGNKEALFKLALARYNDHYLPHTAEALERPTAREVAEHMLYSSAEFNTRYPAHPGCMNINGAIAASDESESVRQALVDVRAAGEKSFRERFARAVTEGDLSPTADPEALAAFLMAVLHGMALQAKAGFSLAMLQAVAKQALAAWPAAARDVEGQ